MTIARGLGPFVVADAEFLPEIDKLLRNLFDELRWRSAGFGSRLLDFLAMLIDTGEKENFLALKPMIARDHIGQHFFISVSDVRRRIGVIDRRSNKEYLRHFATSLR